MTGFGVGRIIVKVSPATLRQRKLRLKFSSPVMKLGKDTCLPVACSREDALCSLYCCPQINLFHHDREREGKVRLGMTL